MRALLGGFKTNISHTQGRVVKPLRSYAAGREKNYTVLLLFVL